MLPKVTGEFRVVTDPTLRFSPSGMPVSEFRVVADKKKKNDETGQWEDDKVCWLTVVCFKKQAENVAESIQKGSLVTVTGNLQTEAYEKDGQQRQSYKVIADNVGVSLAFNAAKTVEAARAASPSAADDPFASPVPTGGTDEPPF